MNFESFRTVKLELPQVGQCLSGFLTEILGRNVTCVATADAEESYWGLRATDRQFDNNEIVALVKYLNGDKDMFEENVPSDSDGSESLGMSLCTALLKRVVIDEWHHLFVSDDAIWITGQWDGAPRFSDAATKMIFVDGKSVDLRKLMTKNELTGKLIAAGCNWEALSDICEEAYVEIYGNSLYWHYPFPDDCYSGCFLVLVQEGILSLSYNEVDKTNWEILDPESFHLCDKNSIEFLSSEFHARTNHLRDVLAQLSLFVESQEAIVDAL